MAKDTIVKGIETMILKLKSAQEEIEQEGINLDMKKKPVSGTTSGTTSGDTIVKLAVEIPEVAVVETPEIKMSINDIMEVMELQMGAPYGNTNAAKGHTSGEGGKNTHDNSSQDTPENFAEDRKAAIKYQIGRAHV